ncbi:MAG TPA: metallophosphoesterase [Thermoleophilaceae bacterium]|nr:metallophosphoesterase [Thermoleophilaceae bacterium]
MEVRTNGAPAEEPEKATVRIAAAGDIHVSDANAEATASAFREVDGTVDLILLAGDLTTLGERSQAEVLARICEPVETPIFAVLGNHDWHAGCRDALVDIVEDAGVRVLDPGCATRYVNGVELGIVGAKGFVGGFPGSHLPDFGEPSLREVYAETGEEVEALDEGLRAVAACPFRIVLLHYAPTIDTLRGEPEAIWSFLGSDRLAAPIIEHQPDLVLHGHAHAGSFEGDLAGVPVFNVSVPVIGRDFWVFELSGAARHPAEIH